MSFDDKVLRMDELTDNTNSRVTFATDKGYDVLHYIDIRELCQLVSPPLGQLNN